MTKSVNLSDFSLTELRALAERVAVEIAKRAETEKAELLAEFEERAKAKGFSLPDLLSALGEKGAAKVAGKKKPAAAKYRNPADPSETWTGRGRPPAWVKAHTDAGGVLEELSANPVA